MRFVKGGDAIRPLRSASDARIVCALSVRANEGGRECSTRKEARQKSREAQLASLQEEEVLSE